MCSVARERPTSPVGEERPRWLWRRLRGARGRRGSSPAGGRGRPPPAPAHAGVCQQMIRRGGAQTRARKRRSTREEEKDVRKAAVRLGVVCVGAGDSASLDDAGVGGRGCASAGGAQGSKSNPHRVGPTPSPSHTLSRGHVRRYRMAVARAPAVNRLSLCIGTPCVRLRA